MAVGPGVGFAPPLVPSHLCGPDWSPVTSWTSVTTRPSKIVLVAPSTRSLTLTGAAYAGAHARTAVRTARVPMRVFM
jgi:hypothetical protein